MFEKSLFISEDVKKDLNGTNIFEHISYKSDT